MAKTLIKYYLMEKPESLGYFFIESVLPLCQIIGLPQLTALIGTAVKQKVSPEVLEAKKKEINEAEQKKK